MPLTDNQQKYLEAIKWLLTPTVGNGKTHLICHAALEVAAENPNTWIYIFDHATVSMQMNMERSVIPTIMRIYKDKYEDTHTITVVKSNYKIKLLPKGI